MRSSDRARRFLALHRRLEAVHHAEAEHVTATLDLALRGSVGKSKARRTDPSCCLTMGSAILQAISPHSSPTGRLHLRCAPYHPITQGKIERCYQKLKNRILLEHYCCRGDLEAQIATFVDDYNCRRYHESIDNLPQPTSTLGTFPPSRQSEKGSGDRLRPTAAYIGSRLPEIATSASARFYKRLRSSALESVLLFCINPERGRPLCSILGRGRPLFASLGSACPLCSSPCSSG